MRLGLDSRVPIFEFMGNDPWCCIPQPVRVMDRKKGTIYLLRCGTYETYVGSTTQPLHGRLFGHWHDACVKLKKSKLYNCIRSKGWSNFTVTRLEHCPSKTRENIRQREQFWIDQLKPTLNTRRAWGKGPKKHRVYTKKDLYWINWKKRNHA